MSAPVSETRRYTQRVAASRNPARRALAAITSVTGLTSSGLVMLAVAISAWILAYVVAGRPMYVLSYGVFTVLVASWLIGRRPLPLEGRRSEGRSRRAEGETISMEVGLRATRRLSTFILEEQVPPLLGQNARIPVASLEPGDEVQHDYQLTCWRRGMYRLGPLVARWGDPFGLTERQIELAEPFEFLVHPSIEAVQDRPLTRLWEDPPIRPPVSKPWPSGMEFYGMRKYEPGDDIRRIVWRAYARTGELLVRESEQGITDKMTVILDNDRRHHSKGVISESFEQGVRAAASVGVRHLREGYSVTLEANPARLAGPLRGGDAPMQFLDALARVDTADEGIADAITRLVYDARRAAHVVLITPRLTDDAASRLQLLLERGSSVLVAALLWDEESVDTLGIAASLGCQVIEIRPNAPLAVAFRHEVGAGIR